MIGNYNYGTGPPQELCGSGVFIKRGTARS